MSMLQFKINCAYLVPWGRKVDHSSSIFGCQREILLHTLYTWHSLLDLSLSFYTLSLYIKQPMKLVVATSSSYELSLLRVPYSREMVGLELEKEAKF